MEGRVLYHHHARPGVESSVIRTETGGFRPAAPSERIWPPDARTIGSHSDPGGNNVCPCLLGCCCASHDDAFGTVGMSLDRAHHVGRSLDVVLGKGGKNIKKKKRIACARQKWRDSVSPMSVSVHKALLIQLPFSFFSFFFQQCHSVYTYREALPLPVKSIFLPWAGLASSLAFV